MKKWLKIAIPVALVVALIAYGVYWAFFDMQRIKGQEVLREVPSPNGRCTITAYRNDGGATTGYAVLCAVRDNQTGRTRNIYWAYQCQDADVRWLDDDTAVINGVELDVWKDAYDFRRE